MQKILDLLQKAGCKPELVQAIGESLDGYKSTIQEQFESDYSAKIEQAKQVCIQETEAHKLELSRRLQIFLETKNAVIEAQMSRQTANVESEAVSKLRNVKSLVEGLEVNGQADNGKTIAVVENAKRKIKQLTEERDLAVSQANKNTAIATKALQRNRQLVKENAEIKNSNGVKSRPLAESRTSAQPRRIDSSRRTQQTQTTRPTLVESQTRKPAETRTRLNTTSGIGNIAANMDEIL